MAEPHGTSRTNFSRDTLLINVGFRHQLRDRLFWIASFGHEVRAPEEDSLALIGYCDVQSLY